MAQYGKTWWGQQWLNALSKIDFDNRLPRGKTYANKGTVSAIEFDKNLITAKVQGSMPKPYKVSLSVSLFSEKEKELLINEIKNNPSLLAQLLNRQLPPEIAIFADKQAVKIFPKSWRDTEMKCSCPDFAVPCKHLAALVFVIANEIDKNPFLIFSLHGLDILKQLQSQRENITVNAIEKIPRLRDFTIDKLNISHQLDEQVLWELDFTALSPLSSKLLRLLQANPVFYDKDFKPHLDKAYRLIAKGAKNFSKKESYPAGLEKINLTDNLQMSFSERFEIDRFQFVTENGYQKNPDEPTLEKLVYYLAGTDVSELEWMSPSFKSLYLIHQFCLHLLENGAVIPQLFHIEKDTYQIRWIPAMMNTEVKSISEKLIAVTPADLLTFKQGNEERFQQNSEQFLSLCSLFLTWHIRNFTKEMGKTEIYRRNIIYSFDPWDEFFFQAKAFDFEDFNEKEIPNAVQLWLNNFYITHKEYIPLLRVEEHEMTGLFTVDILVGDRRKGLQAPVELAKILKEKQYETIRFEVLKDVMLLTEHFNDLKKIIDSHGKEKLGYDAESFVNVLLNILPIIQLFGIRILLPKSLQYLIKPQASLTLKGKVNHQVGSFLSLEQMLEFDWQVALGDKMMQVKDFRKLVKGMSGLVKIKDRFMLIEDKELEKLFQRLENPPRLSDKDLLKTVLSEEFEGAKIGLSAEAANLIRQLTEISEVALPENIQAKLRPYQRKGYEWMCKNTRLGFGSLIADDMGLGKTLQVITLLLKFKQDGLFAKKKGLVVVPTTLLTNWQKEIQKFAPDLKVAVYHGSKRKLETDNTDLIITTYGLIRSDTEKFKDIAWYTVVIDEAQHIKNPGTDQTKAVKSLKSDIKIAMSGTPVENRLSEFWSILDFTNKGYLGNLSKFTDEFSKPIQLDFDQEKLALFRKITAPFLLRRVKTDKTIIDDLPEKIENNHYTALTKEQVALYESVVIQTMKDINENEGIARKGLVLKLMTALKQIGNHPFQYLDKGKKNPELSGKVQVLFELLENIYTSHEKVLIFTQYKEMGELLSAYILEKFQTEPLFLHGGIDRKKRDELVERFSKNKTDHTFILSLKAGGTGLNLVQANHVIHFDLWWNPAVEAQATDRAFRIGQNKNVMVYRLINQGTFEEKINEMLQKKKDLANMSISLGETWIGDLSTDELNDLVKLE